MKETRRRYQIKCQLDGSGYNYYVQCPTCDGGGWMWPNLGVNVPAGASRSVSLSQAMAIRQGYNYYVKCQTCNSDGHKPHPDQAKIDMAKEIDEAGQRSPWKHTLVFDGSSLVDTWGGSSQRNPRKYRLRSIGRDE